MPDTHSNDALLSIQEFLVPLIDHARRRGNIIFGLERTEICEYRIAIVVPTWWYGKVPASAIKLTSGELWRGEASFVAEPIACLSYFLSRNKKHPINNGGLLCHCSMDQDFTVISEVALHKNDSFLNARLENIEIQTLSLTDISNSFREVVEARLYDNASALDEDPAAILSKFNEIQDSFQKHLPRYDAFRDYKFKLPWSIPDQAENAIRNGQMIVDAATLSELVFKKLLLPVAKSLAQIAREKNQKLHVLCSGALSECPYVAQCLSQLLSEQQELGNSVEILSVVNGETSACRGAAIFLDSSRRQTQIKQVELLGNTEKVFINPTTKARSKVLEERGTELKAVGDQILKSEMSKQQFDTSRATTLAVTVRIVLQEQLKRFGFTTEAGKLFVLLYSLYNLLERYDSCKDIRAQFDKSLRDTHASDPAAQVDDTLFWFCKSGATDELRQFLIDSGSRIDNAVPYESETLVYPVHVTVKYGRLPDLIWLLDNGADISAKTSDGETCLHLAIRSISALQTHDARMIVEALIPRFTNKDVLNIEDANGWTALDIAKQMSLHEIIKSLLNAGAQENLITRSLRAETVKVISDDDLPGFQKLLDNLDKTLFSLELPQGQNFLHWAVLNKSFNIVQELFTSSKTLPGIDVNSRCDGGWSSLHLSVEKRDIAMASLLLNNGADVEASSNEMHGWAKANPDIPFGSPGAISFESSVCPSEISGGGWKPLHIAALAGDESLVQILIDNGAYVESTDLEGYTATQRAISNGHEAVVHAILSSEHRSTSGHSTPARTSTPPNLLTDTPKRKSKFWSTAVRQPVSTPSIQQALVWGRNALHDAVDARNEVILGLLLQNQMNPNSQSPSSGWTPLSCAVAQGNETFVRILLLHGADPSHLHFDGSSLLHIASSGVNIKIVDLLLQHISAIAKDKVGATPLHYAARSGSPLVAGRLLRRAADANACDLNGQTPLYYAIESSNLSLAEYLLSHKARTDIADSFGRTPLHAAASCPNPSALQLLSSRSGRRGLRLEDVDCEGNTPLHLATIQGHVETMEVLLRAHQKAKLGRPVLKALFTASTLGLDPVVKVILDHERNFILAYTSDPGTVISTNIDGIDTIPMFTWSCLHTATWHGRSSTVRLLLEHNVSANISSQYSLTPLGLISIIPINQFRPEHLALAATLLNHGADISLGGLENSSLHLAAIAGHEDLVKLFLSRGADISSKNSKNRSALCCAVLHGQSGVAAILLEQGADVKEHNEGRSLLLNAAHLGNVTMLKMLVAKGADINGVSEDGTTTLMAAASEGRVEAVNYLLEQGCPLTQRNKNGDLSALDIAVTQSRLDVVKAILDSPNYKLTFGDDCSYAWRAVDNVTIDNRDVCRYIYERTGGPADNGARILHWAVTEGRSQLLKFLIDQGIDMKTPNSDGWSAFHAAVMIGQLSIAGDILNTGFDINYAGHQSRTALHQAIASNQPESVEFLVSHHPKMNIRDEDLQLPIHIAIDRGSTDALQDLPLSAEDFNSNDFGGQSLVSFAAGSGDNKLLRILLEKEGKLEEPRKSSLHQAIKAGDIDLVRKLIGHGADLNHKDADGYSPLREAVLSNNHQAALALLVSGAYIESNCNEKVTPLASAVKRNDMEMAKLLIDHGADVNVVEAMNGCPILVDAAWRGFDAMVGLLISAGADIQAKTSHGNGALHLAALGSHTAVLRRLVLSGLPVDQRGKDGNTALYKAAEAGKPESVKALLELGAEVNAISDTGYSPLHPAAELDHAHVIDLLLKGGATIDCLDSTARTPIMIAARGGSEAAFDMLHERGAELNHTNQYGWSTLHFAAYGGSVNIGRRLISLSFSPDTRDDFGYTPLHRAASNGKVEFIRFLSGLGADLSSKTNEGDTAICVAANGNEAGRVEAARLLIQLGQNFETPKNKGHTPLMIACEVGNLDMVMMLVEHGASLTRKTSTGWDALHAAAFSGKVAVLDYLLLQGMHLRDDLSGENRNTILNNPALNGHEAMVEAIVTRLPSIIDIKNKHGLNPLQQSVLNGRLGVLKKLCSLGADINVKHAKSGGSLIHLAAEIKESNNASEIVKYLLQKGMLIEATSSQEMTPLKLAAELGRTHAAAALLDNGAEIENTAGKGGRAVDVAVAHGQVGMVELLISRGASITHLSANGNTLLYVAVSLNHVSIVKVLLQHGVAVDAMSNGKWTALHLACSQNKCEIIEILLEHG